MAANEPLGFALKLDADHELLWPIGKAFMGESNVAHLRVCDAGSSTALEAMR